MPEILLAGSVDAGPGPTGTSGSPSYNARIQRFQGELRRNSISMTNLRKLAFYGVPDKDGLRAIVWKLLLGYLPKDTSGWETILASKRQAYQHFCQELLVQPEQNGAAALDDHPLSQADNSAWKVYFKDAEVREQIERDVMRTHPDMHFFSGDDAAATQHREECMRALFIYAKLNPGIRYVQGMNELYAPIYHQFCTDPAPGAAQHAEADAFYCFVDLLSEFRDNFCQQLDNSELGIRATITQFNALLEQYDEELWHHLLATNKVEPQFYAFRWITLLLTQEFPFPDVIRLWDTLFSDPGGRRDCLLRLCVAMLINVRQDLLNGDFSHNLKLLQQYPSVDVHTILHRAVQLKLEQRT